MIYQITVKPGSKKGDLVERVGDNELIVYLKARPVEGKANASLIKILAEHFQVTQNQITIKSGTKSRKKLIEIN